MARPKLNYLDLELAFMSASYDCRYWLDRLTGEILSYNSSVARALEEGQDLSDLHGWEADEVEAARTVLRAFGELPDDEPHDEGDTTWMSEPQGERQSYSGPERYARIEPILSDEAFKFMEEFVATLTNARAREALENALRGGRPFRRFKEALRDLPQQIERWHKFEKQCTRRYIEGWAREQGVDIDSLKRS